MIEPHYHINLFWSDGDNLWIADVPDLRCFRTHGNTRAKALENATEAIEGWIETAREVGLAVPEPKYRPAIYVARDAA